MTGDPGPSRTLNVLDAVDLLRRHWVKILAFALLFAVLAYGLSYLIPPTYRAVAVILPPEEEDFAGLMPGGDRGLSRLGSLGRLGSYFTQADIALAILRSESVHEAVVNDFDLKRRYRTKTLDGAMRQLRGRTVVKMASDGTISVSVQDRDPKMAAQLANAFLQELDHFNREFRSFRARRTRVFLQARVTEVDSSLRRSESLLAQYQRRRGTIVVSPESRGGADAASSLLAQKVAAEVELGVARSYAGPQSEEVRALESRVVQLRRQVADLPSAQIGGADLVRDVTILQQVYGLLTAQLEQFRIREAMDTPTIQVLDSARPPERRSWPRRSWIAGFGFLAGALVGAVVATGFPRRA